MVKISVIIPNYNNAKFLKKSISSVYDQSLKDIETICIDDGSTDDSLKVLDELKQEFSTLKVISQENQGQGNARNAGLKIAAGEYVAFLDSDDVFIDENALERMYELAKKENLNMVTANLAFVDRKYKIKRENPHYDSGDYAFIKDYGVMDIKDYGVPYGFTKSIFNLNFLQSNDIVFPEICVGENNLFLANVFVNTFKIGTVPLYLYGFSGVGEVNKKINTYDGKKQYLVHFKIVCDILSKDKLIDISNKYKNHLFNYLILEKNISDVDLFRIFNDVFSDCPSDYFDKTNENYIQFIISYKLHLLKYSNSEQVFNEIKNEFLSYKLEFIGHIKSIVLKRYLLVVNSNSLKDFKLRYNEFKLIELRNEQNTLKIKNKHLKNEKQELNAELKKVKKINRNLFNSSSWKVTKFLR